MSFFYSDHLNCPSTIDNIRNLFHQDKTFYPPTATWTRCPSHYYTHDAQDSGPISLLALLVIVTHPKPAQNILMPYMHPNITQKCRYWAAATLMFNHNNLPLLPSFPNTIIADLQHQELLSQIDWSIPKDMSTDIIPVPPVLDCFIPQKINIYSHDMVTSRGDPTKWEQQIPPPYSQHSEATI